MDDGLDIPTWRSCEGGGETAEEEVSDELYEILRGSMGDARRRLSSRRSYTGYQYPLSLWMKGRMVIFSVCLFSFISINQNLLTSKRKSVE